MHATSIKRDENGVVSCTGDVVLRRQAPPPPSSLPPPSSTLKAILRSDGNYARTMAYVLSVARGDAPPGSSRGCSTNGTLNFRACRTRHGTHCKHILQALCNRTNNVIPLWVKGRFSSRKVNFRVINQSIEQLIKVIKSKYRVFKHSRQERRFVAYWRVMNFSASIMCRRTRYNIHSRGTNTFLEVKSHSKRANFTSWNLTP